jgi:hypothetical protein
MMAPPAQCPSSLPDPLNVVREMRTLDNNEIQVCTGGDLTFCVRGAIACGTCSDWVGAYAALVDFTSCSIIEPILS